ncbi:MAG: hypothetical protein JWR25_1375 [Noviherbaspirillum sp.]|nr:hypothetical protein [Noviherbaspirillum sp.]MDB5794996.1 hypothetical protein [Noviherbaspirillum sp.]
MIDMQNNPATYVRLQSDNELPAISDAQPFKAIVVIEDEVSQIWQWEVSRWLALSGCRYIMAWGPECAAWAESVEEAHLEAFNYDDIPQERSLMATSHEDEELSEVFWYAKHRAHHPAHELRNAVILHISKEDKRIDLLGMYEHA